MAITRPLRWSVDSPDLEPRGYVSRNRVMCISETGQEERIISDGVIWCYCRSGRILGDRMEIAGTRARLRDLVLMSGRSDYYSGNKRILKANDIVRSRTNDDGLKSNARASGIPGAAHWDTPRVIELVLGTVVRKPGGNGRTGPEHGEQGKQAEAKR